MIKLFKIKRKLYRMKLALSKNKYPSSEPYLSSDTFRSLADHNIQTIGNTIIIPNVKRNDIVFVNSNEIYNFFGHIYPKIKEPFILITHDGVEPVDSRLLVFADSWKIVHWFGKNVNIYHKKITPIPIGLENKSEYRHGIPAIFNKLNSKEVEKKPGILAGFKIKTNIKERHEAFEKLESNKIVDMMTKRIDPIEYLKLLNTYQFVASPPGAGIECHRTWEAIYLGVVPIVKRSYAETSFFDKGAPMWLIDDWDDLKKYDKQALNEKYNSILKNLNRQQKSNMSKVRQFDYWKDIILSKKRV